MSIKRYDSDTKELNDVAGVYRLQGGGATIEVDDELSTLSENPVKNKVITGELNKKLTEVSVMPQNPTDKQTVLFVGETDVYVKGTIYEYSESENKWNPISTAEIDVDDSLDSTSENPVQNKVIVSALGAKQPIRLVSAVTLESHAYDTVPTVLSALATRLNDTMRRAEVTSGLNAKQNLILSSPMMLQSVSYNRTETALGALATRLENTYTKSEVDNSISAVVTGLDWKPTVDTYTDIMAEYPNPEDGWTVNVKDTDITYSYDDESGLWIPISANAIPKATAEVDGLLDKDDFVKLQSTVGKTAFATGLSVKQNVILSSPMMLESASHTTVPTALSALAARMENTYKKQEIDSATDSLESKVTENRQTLGYTSKNKLKVTAKSGTFNGISYTVNTDGSVFVAGGQTATSNSTLILNDKLSNNLVGCILNGGISSKANIVIQPQASPYTSVAYAEGGDSVIASASEWADNVYGLCFIKILSGYTIPSEGLLFQPMIRDANIADSTFVPYQGESVDYRLKEKDDYNLLPLRSGTQSSNGIDFTVDEITGTVTANGTATADAYITVAELAYKDAVGKIYSASPNGSSASTYYGFIAFYASSWLANYPEYGTGLTVPVNESATTVRFEIMIRSGQTVSNLVFKPMITKAEYKGMPFKPFRKAVLRESYAEVYGAKNLFDGLFTSVSMVLDLNQNYDGLELIRDTTSPSVKYPICGAYLPKGQYKLIDCTSLPITINRIAMNGATLSAAYSLYKHNKMYSFTVNYDQWVYFNIERDTSVSDTTDISFDGTELKMMIVDASIESDTYVPYAKTNRQLTEDVAVLPGNVKKNLLRVTAKSGTLYGVTFTVNDDGSITASGTATSDVLYQIGTIQAVKGKAYAISDDVSDCSPTTYRLWIESSTAFPVGHRLATDLNGNKTRTALENETVPVLINVLSNKTVNKTFYPMIRPAGTSPDFVPWCMSNDELTESVETLESENTVKFQTNASFPNIVNGQLYAPDQTLVDTVGEDGGVGTGNAVGLYASLAPRPSYGELPIRPISFKDVKERLTKSIVSNVDEDGEVTTNKLTVSCQQGNIFAVVHSSGSSYEWALYIRTGYSVSTSSVAQIAKSTNFAATVSSRSGMVQVTAPADEELFVNVF